MKWLPDDIDLTDYMQSQEMRQKVRPASDFRADVLQRLKSDPSLTGERLPWKKTEKLIRFRAGELTLWTGINGHGKSKLLGQVATGLMYQGAAVCIASLEMHPAETVKRMVEQAEGNGRRSERYGNQYLDWSDNRLWVYDHVGECKSDRMLALVRYCAAKLQIKHFFTFDAPYPLPSPRPPSCVRGSHGTASTDWHRHSIRLAPAGCGDLSHGRCVPGRSTGKQSHHA